MRQRPRSVCKIRASNPNTFELAITHLTLPTKVPSDSLGRIGSLKRTSDKSLLPMALGSCGHRITHQLRPINMNGRSILSVTSHFAKGTSGFLSPRGSALASLATRHALFGCPKPFPCPRLPARSRRTDRCHSLTFEYLRFDRGMLKKRTQNPTNRPGPLNKSGKCGIRDRLLWN